MPAMITLLTLSLALAIQDPIGGQDATPDTPQDAAAAEPAPYDPSGDIAAIETWLNGLDTLQARFTQVNDVGQVYQGALYMRRPGRLRFEYDEAPILIVADGQTVAIEDSQLETVDRAPLRSTPLWWILKEDVDLEQDARIVQVDADTNRIFLTVEDPDQEMEGRVTFVFSRIDHSLLEWYSIDAADRATRLVIEEMRTGVSLNPRLFILDSNEEDRRRSRR